MPLSPMTGQMQPLTHQFHCYATEHEVRGLLTKLRVQIGQLSVSNCVTDAVEIALAEALNNIVEHGLAGRPEAAISVDICICAAHVFVQVQDPGLALPNARLPETSVPSFDVGRACLPEGGFGWNLIHAVSDRVEYERINNQNRLKMWFSAAPHPA